MKRIAMQSEIKNENEETGFEYAERQTAWGWVRTYTDMSCWLAYSNPWSRSRSVLGVNILSEHANLIDSTG
jgi:hypothetical protein